MNIELNPYVKPINKRPYKLNPRVKQKVKEEIYKMLTTHMIFLLDEFDWIGPIINQDMKTSLG